MLVNKTCEFLSLLKMSMDSNYFKFRQRQRGVAHIHAHFRCSYVCRPFSRHDTLGSFTHDQQTKFFLLGPDYWNMNKRWRLCSLGKKQSPIELSTDNLVYDHLLPPIQLTWLKASESEASNLDSLLSRGSSGEARPEAESELDLQVRNFRSVGSN